MLSLVASAPASVGAQEASAAPEKAAAAEKAPKTRCARGYAFDPSRGECLPCNQPCKTSFKGVCSRGIMNCDGETPVCKSTIGPGERIEICNGEDDDCDGSIDEGFDKDGDRYTTCGGDCNDRDPAIHPDSVERCNARDDNCNGVIDDGFNIGGMCTVGLGECMREGRLACSESGFESVCGVTPGVASPEICDSKDNDCNGKVDDGLGENSCGVGACKRTLPVCEGGRLTECVPGKPTEELCGDEIDNNCDGKVDEGFGELGGTCYEGVGACKNVGKFICSGDLLSIVCSAEAGEPRAELCGNRVDDDCDGTVDDDTPGLNDPCDNGQLGECRLDGNMVCDRSSGSLVCSAKEQKPRKETCDGLDNDCDGQIDNGVLNACGGCGKLPGEIGGACMVPDGDECATGTWSCNPVNKGEAVCVLDSKISEGRECASDENQCTKDICAAGRCTHSSLADGTACDDGDACTQGDSCKMGACAGGETKSCDDANPCTEDSCDSKLGCQYRKLGTGSVNSCGGCEKLPAQPGSPCVVEENFGACRVGQNACGYSGLIECVQVAFGRSESCNGIDDDCNGKVDDELGTTSCGIGACEVEVDACKEGQPAKCVPKDPLPETCANMGIDDDCNGLVDDVASLGERCPVPIGTCIVPGQMRCIGDAEKPICVPTNARFAEDDDGNGVANYCDQEMQIEDEAAEEIGVRLDQGHLTQGASTLFDLSATRAAMLPWKRAFGSTVVNEDSPDRAMLLVSGKLGDRSGLAVLWAKDVRSASGPSFRTCEAAVGESPKLLLAVDGSGGVIAATDNGYLRYHKIASQIPAPSAAERKCRLFGERLPVSGKRKVTLSTGEVECSVQGIKAIALLGEEPLRILGAAECRIDDRSILTRSRSALLIDAISQRPDGGYEVQSIPFYHATGDVERAVIAPLGRGGGAFFASATIKGKTAIGICRAKSGEWKCDVEEPRSMGSPIVFAHVIGARNGKVHLIAIAMNGEAFDISVDPAGGYDVAKAGDVGGRGDVDSAFLIPTQRGRPRTIVLAREDEISSARISWTREGGLRLIRMSKERFGPEAPKDGIYPGGRLSFGKPSAMAQLPLKRFGGEDFFAAFQITKGMESVGEMGFLYMNENEPPRGTLSDITIQGRVGRARIEFTDPTGDDLTYRASIKAAHGGSLDHWIDGVARGILRFSVKNDAAVGLWPIAITVDAVDSGGEVARVKAVVDRDGTVESITESRGSR